MEFKLKPLFNLIFMGLGILFLVYLFPLSSYASSYISSNIYLDANNSYSGVAFSDDFNHLSYYDDYLFPITRADLSGCSFSGSGLVGNVDLHLVTSEGDFLVYSFFKRTPSSAGSSSSLASDTYVNGYPISYYYFINISYIGSSAPSYVPVSFKHLFTEDVPCNESYTGTFLHDKLTYISDNTDVIIDNTELILQTLDASGIGLGHFYGSYSPCNYSFTTTLSDDYDNKVMNPGANIIFCNGDTVVNSAYLNVTSVSSKVYFNSNSSGKYRFVFSSVLNTNTPTHFSSFSFPIYDEDGNVLVRYYEDDFTELIYPFGGNSSGKFVHFFYADFQFQTDSAICGFGLRAQLSSAIQHSYDTFGLYGYTGTVTDLIDWYEKNWSNTSSNVGDLNNNTDTTNDTIGSVDSIEGGYFDSYHSYVDSSGINAFNFDVIGNELAIASGFIGSLYASLPSVFKYFIIGIMTIGTFALILSVGGRISKRRG